MDDLATTERSRWELWAELAHGRVSVEEFESLLQEEIAFLKQGENRSDKRIQVPWNEKSERWYLVAVAILRELVTNPEPVEFATELLLPFTFEPLREASDPISVAKLHQVLV